MMYMKCSAECLQIAIFNKWWLLSLLLIVVITVKKTTLRCPEP